VTSQRERIARLTCHLEYVRELIARGTIGGEAANAADLQIGASVRQLAAIADIGPLLAGHSAAALTRHFPPMVGHIPPGTAPREWLAGVEAVT
jgi:hypothetical protein